MQDYGDYKKIKLIAFVLIFVTSLGISIFYGVQKTGFHEDEYYTYYSSNRTYGLFQPDREWQDSQTIRDEFTVRQGEGFNYSLVKLVQSWDVHPPLYYFLFHTACSLVPGIFTKWTGIIVNLLGFSLAYMFLCLLMEEMKTPIWVEFLTLLFWGLNPQTVSCNMLIRMYAWLGAAVLACGYFHMKLINDYDNNSLETRAFVVKSLLPVAIVAFTGFLIQYFFIFFFFIIGFLTACYLFFFRKDIRNALLYVAACAVGMIAAVAYYPASLHHMFGGYRGGDASGSFFDIGNTMMRLSFFVGLLNDFVFAKGLMILAILIILGVVLRMATENGVLRFKDASKGVKLSKKDGSKAGPSATIVILTVASIGYFLMTSKTALLVGAASNRYEMPIYSLLIYLIFLDVYYVIKSFDGNALYLAVAAVIVMLLVKGHVNDGNVLFLYPEDPEKITYARENNADPECVAVVMFNPATPQNVWRLTDELLEYDEVFYMDEENLAAISDERVTSADRIILYAADDDLQREAFDNLLASTGLSTMTWQFSEDMWCTYEVK